MVAPVAAYVQLPVDTGNTGKKRRTQTRIVGADVAHEDFVIPISKRSVVGNYTIFSGLLTLPATLQDGITAGFLWILNPADSTRTVALKKITASCQFNALAVDNLAGFLRVTKGTFTGTSSGTVKPVDAVDSSMPAALTLARTTPTGITPTINSIVDGWVLPVMGLATGGAGVHIPAIYEWKAEKEEDEIILHPGEFIGLHSAATLTTSNRQAIASFHIQEFE